MDPNLLAVFLLLADIVVILALRMIYVGGKTPQPCQRGTKLAPTLRIVAKELNECQKSQILADAKAVLLELQPLLRP